VDEDVRATSRARKPKPFDALNHLTVPVTRSAIYCFSLREQKRIGLRCAVFSADEVLQPWLLKKRRPVGIALGPASCEFQHEHVPPTIHIYLAVKFRQDLKIRLKLTIPSLLR